MSGKKKDNYREVMSQILFACGGDRDQIDETIDALVGATETYVRQLAIAAYQQSTTANKVKPDDVLDALGNDIAIQQHITNIFEVKKKQQKERKNQSAENMGVAFG